MTLNADSIRIDTDEGQFLLVIDTEEFGTLRVNFHACALEFEDEVRKELRPYALEAASARATMPSSYPEPVLSRPISVEDAIEAGYALDDPKSPGYYDRMID